MMLPLFTMEPSWHLTHSEEQSLRKANRRITIVDGSLAKEEVLR